MTHGVSAGDILREMDFEDRVVVRVSDPLDPELVPVHVRLDLDDRAGGVLSQTRGVAHCGRPEPQAFLSHDRMGSAPHPIWQPDRPAERTMAAFRRLRVFYDRAGARSPGALIWRDPRWPRRRPAAFFQRPGPLS